MDRRAFLSGLAVGALLPHAAARAEKLEEKPAEGSVERLFLSAKADAADRFFVSGFDSAGNEAFALPLPTRGHAVAPHPRKAEAVIFARRPGRFALAIDLTAGEVLARIDSASGRHFYGHGVFSADGALLFATENDYAAGQGVIGLYDARDSYRRIGEYQSHGVGPHDIRLLGDGATLAVANGGILTHPDAPRAKLNLATMAPSLAYLDVGTGNLLAEVRLPREMHQLSIRHLAVGRNDAVAIAMQYQGPSGDLVPLVGVHRGTGEIELLAAPSDVTRGMRNYCGSTAVDSSGAVLGVSAPRGGLAVFWDLASGQLLSTAEVADGCGIAPGPAPATFVVTSGLGGAFLVDAHTGEKRVTAPHLNPGDHWDNHLFFASLAG
jgi:uncharacterized protein